MVEPIIITNFILILIYFLLEVLWLVKMKKSFIIYALQHFYNDIIIGVSNEILKGKKGRRFCGIVLAIQTGISIAMSVFFYHYCYISHEIAEVFLIGIGLIVVMPAFLYVSFWINHTMIANTVKNTK